MFRAVWYIVKVGILVAAVVWLADRPGTVDIHWMEYSFHIQTGLFLTALLVFTVVTVLIYRGLLWLGALPRTWHRYKQTRDREKGHRALARGLSAVAAGDVKAAARNAERAVRYLPKDKGMPLLLQAQAERLRGNEEKAQQIFASMLQQKDTAFLGVRGLLQGALDRHNYPQALELARHGLSLYPQQKWLLDIVYILEIRLKNWNEAHKILVRAEKAGAINADIARSDRVAMAMLEGEELLRAGHASKAQQKFQKAHKMDPYFAPAIIRMGQVLVQQGQRRKAVKLVEKSWALSGHAALAEFWPELMDLNKGDDPLARLKWVEKLLNKQPMNGEGHLVVARAAMEASLWGEARGHLEHAEAASPDSRVYRLRAEIERRSTHDDAEAIYWLEKAENAPAPRLWVCRETGRVYNEWHAIAPPHGSFNTIVWDYADARRSSAPLRLAAGDALFLDTPQL